MHRVSPSAWNAGPPCRRRYESNKNEVSRGRFGARPGAASSATSGLFLCERLVPALHRGAGGRCAIRGNLNPPCGSRLAFRALIIKAVDRPTLRRCRTSGHSSHLIRLPTSTTCCFGEYSSAYFVSLDKGLGHGCGPRDPSRTLNVSSGVLGRSSTAKLGRYRASTELAKATQFFHRAGVVERSEYLAGPTTRSSLPAAPRPESYMGRHDEAGWTTTRSQTSARQTRLRARDGNGSCLRPMVQELGR